MSHSVQVEPSWGRGSGLCIPPAPTGILVLRSPADPLARDPAPPWHTIPARPPCGAGPSGTVRTVSTARTANQHQRNPPALQRDRMSRFSTRPVRHAAPPSTTSATYTARGARHVGRHGTWHVARGTSCSTWARRNGTCSTRGIRHGGRGSNSHRYTRLCHAPCRSVNGMYVWLHSFGPLPGPSSVPTRETW